MSRSSTRSTCGTGWQAVALACEGVSFALGGRPDPPAHRRGRLPAGGGEARHFPEPSIRSILYASGYLRLPGRALVRSRRPCPNERLATDLAGRDPCVVEEPLIERDEVVALLFNVSDIVSSLARIERLLEEDNGEEEADRG